MSRKSPSGISRSVLVVFLGESAVFLAYFGGFIALNLFVFNSHVYSSLLSFVFVLGSLSRLVLLVGVSTRLLVCPVRVVGR